MSAIVDSTAKLFHYITLPTTADMNTFFSIKYPFLSLPPYNYPSILPFYFLNQQYKVNPVTSQTWYLMAWIFEFKLWRLC